MLNYILGDWLTTRNTLPDIGTTFLGRNGEGRLGVYRMHGGIATNVFTNKLTIVPEFWLPLDNKDESKTVWNKTVDVRPDNNTYVVGINEHGSAINMRYAGNAFADYGDEEYKYNDPVYWAYIPGNYKIEEEYIKIPYAATSIKWRDATKEVPDTSRSVIVLIGISKYSKGSVEWYDTTKNEWSCEGVKRWIDIE